MENHLSRLALFTAADSRTGPRRIHGLLHEPSSHRDHAAGPLLFGVLWIGQVPQIAQPLHELRLKCCQPCLNGCCRRFLGRSPGADEQLLVEPRHAAAEGHDPLNHPHCRFPQLPCVISQEPHVDGVGLGDLAADDGVLGAVADAGEPHHRAFLPVSLGDWQREVRPELSHQGRLLVLPRLRAVLREDALDPTPDRQLRIVRLGEEDVHTGLLRLNGRISVGRGGVRKVVCPLDLVPIADQDTLNIFSVSAGEQAYSPLLPRQNIDHALGQHLFHGARRCAIRCAFPRREISLDVLEFPEQFLDREVQNQCVPQRRPQDLNRTDSSRPARADGIPLASLDSGITHGTGFDPGDVVGLGRDEPPRGHGGGKPTSCRCGRGREKPRPHVRNQHRGVRVLTLGRSEIRDLEERRHGVEEVEPRFLFDEVLVHQLTELRRPLNVFPDLDRIGARSEEVVPAQRADQNRLQSPEHRLILSGRFTGEIRELRSPLVQLQESNLAHDPVIVAHFNPWFTQQVECLITHRNPSSSSVSHTSKST